MRKSGYVATTTILGMLCLMYMITYIDRVNISTAAGVFRDELKFSATDYGKIFAAFGYTYAMFQIVGGWIVLADGTQVGITRKAGTPSPAPKLNVADRSAVVDGTTITAAVVDGTTLS